MMKKKFLTIGVDSTDLEEVRLGIEKIDFFNWLQSGQEKLRLTVELFDLRENYSAMKTFLKEQKLEDENVFFNEFEMDPFGIQIDFEMPGSYEYLDILEPAVFMLAKHISNTLRTKTIVLFDNMRIPVGLFDNGNLSATFEKYNNYFFQNKVWCPLSSSPVNSLS